MLKASVEKITLQFKQAAGTSRGILKTKNSWIISIWDSATPETVGLGEASIIENLSPEWDDQFEIKLQEICAAIDTLKPSDLQQYPSIRFAVEAALLDLKNGGKQHYFKNDFTEKNVGIKINGLIWMGEKEFMFEQIKQKLEDGFSCLKLKIGAIDFEEELSLLEFIRSKFSKDVLELRVDANGAFSPEEALQKLKALHAFQLHSIEQPIRQSQWNEMAKLCNNTPIPIALDEELIGVNGSALKQKLLRHIEPQYIILKPSLIGGFAATDEWIKFARQEGVDWWITSALEANVGLNAIAQYTAEKNNPMPQGLGTGQLFQNNIESTLNLKGEYLFHQ